MAIPPNDEPNATQCDCGDFEPVAYSITISGFAGECLARYDCTQAALMIARLPPWRFNQRKADRLGDACVREIEK